MENFLNPTEIENLKKELQKAKNKGQTKIAYRINAILLLNRGWSYQQVADALFLDDQTIRRYENSYQQKGLDALKHSHYKGGLGYLTKAQEQELSEHLDTHFYRKAKEIVAYIEKTYLVSYSEKGITHLLERLGFVYKKPKRVPGKADPEKQGEFLRETYQDIKAIKGKHDRIYFADGVHPKHNPVAPYGWIRKGKIKEMPTNTGRDRLNINAAIDVTDFDFIFRQDDRVNACSTIALFKQIEEANPKAEFIFVIADNARYYKNKEVGEYLENSKIVLVFLPPYAPNLNLIERLWRFLRENVLCRYYERFKDFREACFQFLNNLSDYKEQLKSLLTENFQITGRNISQTCCP